MDWKQIFIPSGSLIELVLRGTLVYLSLFIILRVMLNRQAGSIGISDLLLVMLIANAAQNAISDDYKSVTEGVVLVITIVGWSYALDWLGYRFPQLQRFLRPPPLRLIKDGQILHRNLRRELITEEELMSQIRQQGIDDISRIKEAVMEGDGRVSVVTEEPEPARGTPDRKRAP
jgi:uncharacterized membrane protein YcaP (DUF421 family)